ncbi:type II toxin-antitoxin system RelE/ParE family toxin [Saccharopolyspora elongata]|uniref:Type II toxin-antitoxin system RelE/ParE family toxin n=1 Tax=Saccharopolyspora elongata TaxID=2530387 RepID=A0A4R4Z0B1_9PSEU|nr:type II toxin-antitoxin system RelE/ParE family toxin [Saccharopolyspora elongata]TDD51166.1 type II toxin-antitoxin system RelE/ParE family toxin [Saccharopolyspora elongata]
MSREPGGGQWNIVVSHEVERWYCSLKNRDRAIADRMFDLLSEFGPLLGMPHSKHLGGGLRELRFHCEGVERRVTYVLDPARLAITLTTFRKQRSNERREVARARTAMRHDRRP